MGRLSNKLSAIARFKHYLKNESGNVTQMLALTAMPLVLSMGMVIDYGRAVTAQTMLQASLDSTAVFAANIAANNEGELDDDLTTNTKPIAVANFSKMADTTITEYSAKIVDGDVVIKAKVKVKGWFIGLIGEDYANLYVTASSEAVKPKAAYNLEIALVLDNTTSMGSINSKTNNKAIDDLKSAATNFVTDTMSNTPTGYYTKIAVVPYNNSVNLSAANAVKARGSIPKSPSNSATPGYGQYTFANAGNSSTTLNISNCVSERTGTNAYTDVSVSGNPVGRVYAPTSNACAVTPMVPLTSSQTTLTTAIGTMTNSASTASQVGLAWGWYALSPTIGMWTGTEAPAAYSKLTTTVAEDRVKKILIFMTDGENNSAYANGVISGSPIMTGSYAYATDLIKMAPSNGDSYAQAESLCTAAKAKGVEIYVVTFQLDKTVTKRVDLTSKCASDAGHLIDADTTSLSSAFSKIATKLVALRLAK
jgi:Putative Flp pilus-assembly TadE/G-like